MVAQQRPRDRRRAMTLVELLVVISIAVLLLVMAVPLLRPALKDRKIREASRQINAQFAGAKARAAEQGRPVGVWIERMEGSPGEAFQLFMAEVAAPYSGDTLDARATLDGQGGYGTTGTAEFPDGFSTILPSLVRQGDFIRFNFRGPWYRITADPSDSPVRVRFTHPSAPSPPATAAGLAYQILRQPAKSILSPLELPSATVIDLENSGFGAEGTEFNTTDAAVAEHPVVIMFSPGGAVTQVYVGGAAMRPTGSIHLLIGRNDQVGEENLHDNSNFWISIGARSGHVTTAENAWDAADPTIATAREFARAAQTMGGR